MFPGTTASDYPRVCATLDSFPHPAPLADEHLLESGRVRTTSIR